MSRSTGSSASAKQTTALLEAHDVACGYHGHAVISGIDLAVQPGEIVAVLGPNGAGKTTTLLALAGELRLLSGSVTFNGKATTDPLFRRARDGMALVTEERSVFTELTTAENLRIGRCNKNLALELFPELRPLLNRQAGLLSGGEQQILTLARALAREPRLLLADELSLGLAPMVVTRLLTAIREAANARSLGVLLVEQHMNQVLRIADRVYVMRRGRIVTHGTPAEVRGELESSYLGDALPVVDNPAQASATDPSR